MHAFKVAEQPTTCDAIFCCGIGTMQHYSVYPFSLLPANVVDKIFACCLDRQHLYYCSRVCQAWRQLPHSYVHVVAVGTGIGGLQASCQVPSSQLQYCNQLTKIVIRSTTEAGWLELSSRLAQQPLPTLRQLHIQHSENLHSENLLQLQNILRVQGSKCRLWLALTDEPSLAALVPLLPWQQLTHLDLNMLRLASAAAPVVSLFVQAATLQLAGRAKISDKRLVQKETAWDGSSGRVSDRTHCTEPAAAVPRNAQQQQPWQQDNGGFTAGLWISSWGASNGLTIKDAAEIWQKLRRVGCQLSSCSSVKCHSVDLNPLGQLTGLKSLGLTMQGPIKEQPPDDLAAFVQVGHDTWQQNIAALAAIADLKDSLQELSIIGCPLGGFCPPSSPPLQQQVRQAQAHQLHPLASLTGLTKLSLLKEWFDQPIELFPLAFLTQLQELTIERMEVESQAELRCLGNLRQLKKLSFFLLVDAREVLASRSSRAGQQQEGYKVPPPPAAAAQAAAWPAAAAAAAAAAKTAALAGATVRNTGHGCACCCGWPLLGEATLQSVVMMLFSCPCSMDIDSPVLLDWSWLKQLQQLEVARLTVPHLDLACLPSSLVELDVGQGQARQEIILTTTGGSGFGDGPGSGARVHLPRLKKLTLPHPLVVARGISSTAQDTISDSAAVVDDGGDDKIKGMGHDILQMHQSSLLLLALAAGCPELRSLDLLHWQLPTGIVLATVNRLQYLSWLSLCPPDTVAGEELKLHLAAMVREAAIAVRLQQAPGQALSWQAPWH